MIRLSAAVLTLATFAVLASCRSTPGGSDTRSTPICPGGGTVEVRNSGPQFQLVAVVEGGRLEPVGNVATGTTRLLFSPGVRRFITPGTRPNRTDPRVTLVTECT